MRSFRKFLLGIAAGFILAGPASAQTQNPNTYRATQVSPAVPWYNTGDATSGVQAAISFAEQNRASGQGSLPLSISASYAISSLTVTGGTSIHFNNQRFHLNANSTTDTGLSLNGDFNILYDLGIVGQYSTANYTSAMHWYTYNLSLLDPGFNRIEGLYTEGCDICLDIGMPPNQYNKSAGAASGWGISSVPTTAPNAQSSPISESYIKGWISNGAIRPLWMAQSNAKIAITDSQIIANANQWVSPSFSNVAAITMLASSSVNVSDSSIEASPATNTGRFLDLEDQSATYLVNDILEASVPIFLSDSAQLWVTHAADFGFNTSTLPVFIVTSTWNGNVVLDNSLLLRLPTVTTPMIESMDTWNGSIVPNINGRFQFSNFIFENYTGLWDQTKENQFCGYVVCRFSNSFLRTTNASTGAVTSSYVLSDGEDVLKLVADETAATAPIVPSTATGTYGGWTVSLGGAGTWGQQCGSLPAVQDLGQVCAYELIANGGNSSNFAQLTSAKMTIRADKLNTLREFVTTNGGGGNLVIQVLYFNQAGSAMSHASDNLFSAALNTFEATWGPHTFILPPPCAAAPSYPCTPVGTSQIEILEKVDSTGNMQFLQPTVE